MTIKKGAPKAPFFESVATCDQAATAALGSRVPLAYRPA